MGHSLLHEIVLDIFVIVFAEAGDEALLCVGWKQTDSRCVQRSEPSLSFRSRRSLKSA